MGTVVRYLPGSAIAGRGSRREDEPEFAAGAGLAVHLDAGAERAGRAAGDRQAQAGAAGRAVPGVVGAVEPVEDLLQVPGAMPVPVSRTAMITAGGRRRRTARISTLPAARGVTDRVGDEVADHSVDQSRVGVEPGMRARTVR